MRNTLLRDAISATLHGGTLIALAAAPIAFAQDQDEAEELETITVVGSRIKRTDIETSQPVFVMEREDLQKTGLTSVGDILQELTTNGAALNTSFNNGGNGTTNVALRNLGANRTLVLVNGRRWVTSLGGAVDLNTIPTSIIERVEVLKDGASAIYGSDAIAGVINITTRDTYDGAEPSAYLGENEEGDGRVEQYDFTVGSSTDRASVLMNASYTKQEPIFAGDREIAAVPLFGFPGNNVNAGASSTTPFGRFDGPGIPGTVVLIPGRPGCVTNQGCTPTSIDDFTPFDANEHGFNFAPDNYLQTPQERTSIYAQARYNLTDSITFRTEVLFNERRSSQVLAATPLVLGPIVGANFGSTIIISPDSVYNPFGVEVNRVQYRNTRQLRVFAQDADTFRFGAGLEGTFDLFDRSFSWDASYVYNDNETRTITEGLFNMQNIALGSGPSFIDATGVARCGTPDAVIAGCVPVNFFGGPDAFTQEMVDFTTYTDQTTNYKKLYNYTGNVTGDLFELPAGPLSFAAGYEYRREFGFNQPDAFTASGLSSGNAAQPTRGGFSVDEFYIEFNVPVLKDVALAEIFEFSIAARYSDYSNFGDTTNPKFGFRWKPFADLLVRGNWAEGFRAPSVTELFLGTSDAFPQVLDPCSASQTPSGAVAERCFGGFGGVGAVPQGYEQANTQIRITGGGNPNLLPEFAESKTLGFVYSPSWLEGLDVYLDWYNIEVVNSIAPPTGQFLIDSCYVFANTSSCQLITRGPTGEVLDIFAGNNNTPGGTEVEGYDLTVNYRFDTEFGRFNLNWDNAYTSYFGDVGQPGFGELNSDGNASFGNSVGILFGPARFPIWRWRSNLTTTWQLGDWGATLGMRYYPELDEDCTLVVLTAGGLGQPERIEEICDAPNGTPQFPNAERTVEDAMYFDAQATWDAPWNGRITAGVRNLTDEEPPFSASAFANSYDPSYDIPGRFWYVQYTQRF